jgi:hypothetical protein
MTRPLPQPDTFLVLMGMVIIGTLITAIDLIPQYNAVTKDLAAAISTAW